MGGVCRLIATHVVSSDLTSHIPAQEGWSLRWRGRGLEGAGFVGLQGGILRSWGKGLLGTWKYCAVQTPGSLNPLPGPLGLSLPVFPSILHCPKYYCGPHSCDEGTDLVPTLNKKKRVAEVVPDMHAEIHVGSLQCDFLVLGGAWLGFWSAVRGFEI